MRFIRRNKQVWCTNCGFLSWRFYRPEDGTITKEVECSSSWRKRIQTNKDLGPLEDPETGEEVKPSCLRGQWVFGAHVSSAWHDGIDVDGLVQPRQCIFYVEYEPGFSPEEHKELMREAQTRKTVRNAAIMGAGVGGSVAIIAQMLYYLLLAPSA